MSAEGKLPAGRRKATSRKVVRPAGLQAGDAKFWKRIVKEIRAVDALQHGNA